MQHATPTVVAAHSLLRSRHLAHLSSSTPPDAGLADAAAALLGIADDNGLAHLRAVALDWIVHHYEAVARTGEICCC